MAGAERAEGKGIGDVAGEAQGTPFNKNFLSASSVPSTQIHAVSQKDSAPATLSQHEPLVPVCPGFSWLETEFHVLEPPQSQTNQDDWSLDIWHFTWARHHVKQAFHYELI